MTSKVRCHMLLIKPCCLSLELIHLIILSNICLLFEFFLSSHWITLEVVCPESKENKPRLAQRPFYSLHSKCQTQFCLVIHPSPVTILCFFNLHRLGSPYKPRSDMYVIQAISKSTMTKYNVDLTAECLI